MFVVLAANLMGAFEILLPSWLLNSTQSGQKKGGLIAPLLMGLTFSLTSFTCTSPFVGTVLLDAAHGHYFYPFVGMLAFSTAFALPVLPARPVPAGHVESCPNPARGW